MKNILLFTAFLLIAILSTTNIYANVYASGIRVSDDTTSSYQNAGSSWDGNFANGGVKLWFIINEDGVGTLSATVTIKQGSTIIRTLPVPSPQKGVNSIIWDGYDNSSNPAPIGTYSFEVLVSDPVGHPTFDSMWVAAAYYQGPDPDGGTAYAYRGNASILETNAARFGNLYVSRGTSSANGFYEFRADGEYIQKIGADPSWPSSTPNELYSIGETVWGLAGYGFANAGYVKGYSALTGNLIDSALWGTSNVRGLFIRYEAGDTVFYTARSGTGLNPAIIKKVGVNGDTSTVVDMAPYITSGSGYIKGVVVDDGSNIWVIYGNASASRNRIARFNSLGVPFFDSSLVSYGLPDSAYFSAIAIDRGPTNSSSDDKIYLLVYGGSTGSPEGGIFTINQGGETLTQLVAPAGLSSAATSQIINVDKAGNVIWSNGGTQERIIAFSPAGPNSYTTPNPTAMNLVVTQIVPVELTSFAAAVVDNKVMLTWSTATETNNSGFAIERKAHSAGGMAWEKIGFVEGKGTTTEIRKYSFVDEKVNSGKYSYRLKQIDFDGTASYSDVVEIEVGIPDQFELSQNYPNPFNPVTSIKYKVPHDAKVQIAVYSINGELVALLVDEFKSAGTHEVVFDASGYASGTYIYRLIAGTAVVTKKMSFIK